MQTNSQIRQSSLAAMKGNWGSAILLYVVSCVLYVPYGILNRGGAIYGHEIEMYTVEQGEKRDKRQ